MDDTITTRNYTVSTTNAMPRGVVTYSPISNIATLETDDIIDEIMRRMKTVPKMRSLSCLHCGATLTMRIDDHIVKCQYCGSAYAIDTEMIRDVRCEDE